MMVKIATASDRPPRIVVRGVNWLGDAVMATPALLRLREALPAAHIAVLSPAKLAGLWPGHPAVDSVEEFTAADTVWTVARRLRALRFDAAVIFPNSPRSALEMWLARIPLRIGLARPWRCWLLTHALAPRAGHVEMRKRSVSEIRRLTAEAGVPSAKRNSDSRAHHLHQYLHLVAVLGANPIPLPPQIFVSEAETDDLRKRIGVAGKPVLGLAPGAEFGPAKRWPADRFVKVAQTVLRQIDCRILVFGGQGDLAVADQILQALPEGSVVNLAGATTLRELCAALRICRVVVANDTGPMHLAAAVGAPVVALFGSTSPALTAPGLPGDPRHYLCGNAAPCAPCFRRECPIDLRCLNAIAPDEVAAAAVDRLRS